METIIATGKTKRVERMARDHDPRYVRLTNTDDTTAGDGARHELITGKAELSTRTNTNIALLLKACGFSLAFREQDSPTSFIAHELDMIHVEVVSRGLAWGSHLERNTKAVQGDVFDPVRTEFFLKTKGKQWPGRKGVYELDCDDPYMVITDTDVFLHHAHKPFTRGTHFLRLSPEEAFPLRGTRELLPVIAATNRAIYETLRFAWSLVGELEDVDIVFPDMKVEYGFDSLGRLEVGDVIDAESCRLLVNGEHASKEGFRQGATGETAKLQLARAADLSDRFGDVTHHMVAWAKDRFVFRTTEPFPALRW